MFSHISNVIEVNFNALFFSFKRLFTLLSLFIASSYKAKNTFNFYEFLRLFFIFYIVCKNVYYSNLNEDCNNNHKGSYKSPLMRIRKCTRYIVNSARFINIIQLHITIFNAVAEIKYFIII